tara:strand:+ start:6564 stop:8471 length:1908 start_codon:yes stop_codon:yes gene_type:complete
MFKNVKISTRIIIGFSAVIILILGLIIPVVNYNISELVYDAEQKKLENLYKSASAEIESEGRIAQAMSYIVASNPEMSKAMAESQRDKLAEQVVPLFEGLKKQYAVRQFQFHLPPATSFLRAHKREKFGDDLSSFRKTILATNQNKTPVKGLEKGVAGIGIRGISPVYHQGSHIGSVEFGMSFGQAFFEQFKDKYQVDIGLYVKRDSKFEVFGSTIQSTVLDNELLLKAFQNQNVLERIEISHTPYAVFGKSITDFSGQPIGVLVIAMDRSEHVNAIKNTQNSTLILGGLSLIGGIFIAIFIGRTIVNPITIAVEAMNEIAEGDGDLSKRLEADGRNEISLLGEAFNRFAEKVRKMVLQVGKATEQLAASAEEMSTITNLTNNGVKAQQAETEMVATAMNQMTATVLDVANNATKASKAAQKADQEAVNGKAVVEKTVTSIDVLAKEIETSSHLMQELESNSVNIGTVLVVIRSIAEQTNLLALNAAIEAARAGEQGRGFAVVADEVRTLASRTQESTQEIQSMIEKLQQGSKNVVDAMQQSKDKSSQSVIQAESALVSLNEITNSVTTISEMNIQIAGAASEQSNVAEEINKNIVNISGVVDETAEGAKQTLMASQELASLANDLQNLVAQFKT